MKDPTKKRRPWPALILAGLAALVIGGHGLAWRAGATEMRRSVDDWIADRRAEGLQVEHGVITMRGYPLILRARAPDVAIGAGETWRWRAEALDIDLSPAALDRLTFRPRGEQTLEAAGVGLWRYEAADARAVLANDVERLWLLTVASGSGEARNGDVGARIGALDLEIGPNADNHGQVEARLRAEAIGLDFGADAIAVPRFHADVGVAAASSLSTAEDWRAAGGAVMLHDVTFTVEGAEGSLSGILTLDASGAPAGVIDADIKAPAGLARALGKAGVLSPEDAAQTEAGLAMASLVQGGRLKGPVMIRDGEVTLAGVPLGRVAAAP